MVIKFLFVETTGVVLKLVLILFGRICNAICRHCNKVHVFCRPSTLQQAPADVCMSNTSQFALGFVKTVAYTPLKKGKKKMTQNKLIHKYHPHFLRPYI